MTTDGRNEPLLQLLDTLQQYQLRNAGAEIAAAIAHALGTPLNVISGRAELIRQDPTSALAQVARIEEQVRKVANGLRQLVDYLAVPEGAGTPFVTAQAGSVEPGSGPATLQSGGVERALAAPRGSESALTTASVGSVLDDLSTITQPIAEVHGVRLELNGGDVREVTLERWHALAMLNTLVSLAIRHVGQHGAAEPSAAHIKLTTSQTSGVVAFELSVPGLDVIEGWHLEHFQVRPPSTQKLEPYRTLSICAAMARGRGGKLLIEASPDEGSALLRFSCRIEPELA